MNSAQIKVKCQRCGGRGIVPHLTARDNNRCFRCNGLGHTFRARPGSRKTEADRIAEMNANLRAGLNVYGKPLTCGGQS